MTRPRLASILVVAGLAAATTGCTWLVHLDGDDTPDTGAIDGGVDPDADPLLSCAIDLPCPPPEAGKATVCGRIHDMESDQVIAAAQPTRAPCGGGGAADGPCALRLRYYDALDFAMSPGTAMPMTPERSRVDDCGRFRGENLPRATFGFIGVVVDDAASGAGHTITTVTVPNAEAVGDAQLRAYATRDTTLEAWSLQAGIGGATFGERGALVLTFVYQDQPVAGVTVRRNGSSIPADDYYFSDTGVTRTTIDPGRTSTGPNGTVVVSGIGSQTPIHHDGVGAEPSGCVWHADLAAAIPGVIWMQRRAPETTTGGACP